MKENAIEKKVKINMNYNYKMFKFIKGNRPLVATKVKKLIADYESGLDLFPYCPILINKDNYVIDGQHRLEACKKLKLPVYFIIIPQVTILQIAQMNATATRWKASDFFNCFIETGNPDYTTLQLFKEKYSLSINQAVSLLMFGVAAGGGSPAEQFRTGKFVVNHAERANKIMKAVNDYNQVADKQILTDRDFIRCIQVLLSSDLYKHKDVVEKLNRIKCKIEKKASYKDYIFQIEALFNTKNSKRQVLYQSSKSK